MAESDIFGVDAQGEFIKGLGSSIAQGAKDFGMNGDESALDPLSPLDKIVESLRTTGAPDEYISAVQDIKQDADVQAAVDIFQKALDGRRNVHDIIESVPQDEGSSSSSFVAFRDDPGLNALILTGNVKGDGETDLVRFSNYISGAGTTFGGALASLPQSLTDMMNGINNATLRKYTLLHEKLEKHNGQLQKVIKENEKMLEWNNFKAEDARRKRKGFTVDISDLVSEKTRQKVDVFFPTAKQRLEHKTGLINDQLERQKLRRKGKLRAQKILGKVGRAVQGVTGGFGVALGGVDIAAGDEMIDNAERRFQRNEISKQEYETTMRNARLRMAQGALGIGDGINNIRQIVQNKLSTRVSAMARGPARQAGRMALRFASAVGGAFAIGMGITSITKNAIAADDARKSGNIGKSAIYGIMASIDCASVALDGVSMVLDFIPGIGTALSLVADLANTILAVVNMVIGFFADMVDTRTPEEKLREAFKTHIESSAFQSYIDSQAEMYKEQGYDLFIFMTDARAVGVVEEGADDTAVKETIVKKLSERAKADGDDQQLRVALRDAGSLGEILKGRLNDDLILAGVGADTLYGLAGDDLLFGEAGNDTIYGGEGNDYLNGGASLDALIGGPGDDMMRYEPGIDLSASGEEGVDTLQISADFFAYNNNSFSQALVFPSDGIHRVYVNLAQQEKGKGFGGVALGALINNFDALKNPMHKPAFASNSDLARRFVDWIFWRGRETTVSNESLNGKYLWYLLNRKNKDYFTDGRYFYSCYEWATNENREITKATYDMHDLSQHEGYYDESNRCMALGRSQKLEAMLSFAFRRGGTISGIEIVSESSTDDSGNDINISSQVIGDESVRLIDVGYGHNEYVYTGDGDTVVLMTLSNSPQWEICKYIIGGDGNNTLVVNGGNRSAPRPNRNNARHQILLLDHDIDLGHANREQNVANRNAWPSAGENKVDRGVFIKNMQTVQLTNSNPGDNTFHVDSTNLSQGHRFIIDNSQTSLRFVGTAGDDNICIKRFTGTDNIIDGWRGKNMLDMEFSEMVNQVDIDLSISTEHVSGNISGDGLELQLNNIDSIRGNAHTRSIRGQQRGDNLLVASGGECEVYATGGSNTLVARRGRHILTGGPGQDGYELYGPQLTEFIVITVTNRDTGVVAQAAKGSWSNSRLTINVLSNDHQSVLLTRVNIVGPDGHVLTGKGSISISNSKRNIVYEPGTFFDSMNRNSVESLRVQYVTEGSCVIIREVSDGNRLRFRGIANKSQLTFCSSDDGDLLCTDSTGRLVFTDERWGDLYRLGIRDLGDLILNFADRFPIIQFDGTDTENSEISGVDVFKLLKEKMESLEVTCNTFSNMIDATAIDGDLVDVQEGDNFVLATRRNLTYTAESGSIFDLTRLGTASQGSLDRTSVQNGSGDGVVAIGNSPDSVRIQFLPAETRTKVGGVVLKADRRSYSRDSSTPFPSSFCSTGKKTVVVDGLAPNDLQVVQNGSQWTFSSTQGCLAVVDTVPDLMMFHVSAEHPIDDDPSAKHILIHDVPKFLARRKSHQDYNHRCVYNSNYEQKLWLGDFDHDDIKLRISVEIDGFVVTIMGNETPLYTSWTGISPNFSLERRPTPFTLDAMGVAEILRLEFKNGIVFSDCTLEAQSVPNLVMDCLRSTDRHTVSGSPSFAHVIYTSTHQGPTKLGSGDALIHADQDGGEIYAGEGNTVIKVTASNHTVNTGRSQDNDEGHDIVHIAENISNISVQFKDQRDNYKIGTKYVIIEGISCEACSFEAPDGTAVGEYYGSTRSFIMKTGESTVATFDCSPSHFVFHVGGDYEIVDDAFYYVKNKSTGRWKKRWVLNRDLMAMFIAEDISSTDLTFRIQSHRRLSVTLRTSQIVYMDSVRVSDTGYTEMKKSDLAISVAKHMPGGIRFRDRTVESNELIGYIEEVISRSEVSGLTLISGDPIKSLEQSIESSYPYANYLDVLRRTSEGLEITNIHPTKTVLGHHADVETPKIVIDNGDAASTPTPGRLQPVLITSTPTPSLAPSGTAPLQPVLIKPSQTAPTAPTRLEPVLIKPAGSTPTAPTRLEPVLIKPTGNTPTAPTTIGPSKPVLITESMIATGEGDSQTHSLEWIEFSNGSCPDDAVEGGIESNGNRVFVVRATIGNELTPGKMVRELNTAYIPWGGKENTFSTYEVLTNPHNVQLTWRSGSNGSLPSGAVEGGSTTSGETLFVGRAMHNGIWIPGKFLKSFRQVLFSYGGVERAASSYEVLCIS